MADRTVRVRIDGDASGLMGALSQAAAAARTAGSNLEQASRGADWGKVSTGLLAVGGTLTAVAGYAVKMGADFDEAMSHVSATGSDAQSHIGQLRDLAIDMGAKTKYSATEAANGIEILAKAGMSATDILNGGLSGALALAASDNMSLEAAAEATATTLTQFGLAGSDAGHVADLLAAGAGKAMGSVQDLSDALKNGGLVASNMGMSLEETVGTLALFAQNGIVGAEAGTQLKVMLQKLQNPSSTAKKAMDELGLSAYDSSGKFVGMADIAQQLQEKTANLSQAQRDQAMAQIFGSHAISAATVLYKAGAQGVDEWASAVNDQGFAEEQASQKMDNLKGDIEQLGGAFETLMISAGNSAQGPLRAMVQGLTGILDKLNDYPGVTQAAIMVIGALGVAMVGLGASMKAVTAISEFRAAMQSLTGMAGIIDTVKTAGAGLVQWGRDLVAAFNAIPTSTKAAAAGYAILTVAIAAAASALSDSLVKTDEIHGAMGQLQSGSLSASDAMRQISDAAGGAYLSLGGPSGLAQAMRDAADPGPLEGIMSFAAGLLGMQTTTETARDHVSALDQEMAKLVSSGSAQAGPALQELGGYIREAGLSASDTVSQFSQTADALRQQAQAAGVAGLSDMQLAEWMRTGVAPAAVQAGQAATGAADAQQRVAESADQAGMSAQDYASTLQSLTDALNQLGDAAISASDAQIKVEDAIAKANQAAQQNGQNLDISTQAGRANQGALNDLAESALKARDAMVKNSESLEDINGSTAHAREAFVNAAQAMGMSADEANRMADAYGLTSMTVEQAAQAQQEAAQASEQAGQAAAGTADNFEYMGRKAGIGADDMYKLAQSNQEAAQAIDTTAQSYYQQRDAAIANGASQDQLNQLAQQARDSIISQAQAMGMSKDQAEQLANAYGMMQLNLDMSKSSIDNSTTAMENNARTAGLDSGMIQQLAQSHQQGVVALQAYAQQARDAAAAQDQGSMSADQAAQAQANARSQFISTARQMGLNQQQAERLADAYGLIPGHVETDVSAPGAASAIGAAIDMRNAVNAIPGSHQTTIGTSADLSGVYAAQAAINSLPSSKTVLIQTIHRSDGGPSGGGGGGNTLARGGPVWGAGTATSDSIPAWLSNGEFVMRAAAVRHYGLDFMLALNAMRGTPRFAGGGPVRVSASAAGSGGGRAPVQNVINVEPQVITEGQLDRVLVRSVESVAARVLGKSFFQGV